MDQSTPRPYLGIAFSGTFFKTEKRKDSPVLAEFITPNGSTFCMSAGDLKAAIEYLENTKNPSVSHYEGVLSALEKRNPKP